MGRANKCPGLRLRGGVYWIDIANARYGRIYESTGASESQRDLAETKYHQRLGEAYAEKHLGKRRRRTFKEAAKKHLEEVKGKKCEEFDQWALDWALPHIGALHLEQIHDGTLQPLKTAMVIGKHDQHGRVRPCKGKTINLVLEVVRKILVKCARKYRDKDADRCWMDSPPLIEMVETDDSRPPYPLSWDEERKLLVPELPAHLLDPMQFIANTGPRSVSECCSLRWEWERRMPELDTPDSKVILFVLPTTKNGEERVLVLNRTAQEILERQRGKHPDMVWTWRRSPKSPYLPLADLNTTAWVDARARAAARYKEVLGRECPEGFRTLHVHDWRHTFGRRLRAAGVSQETRAKLLGHSDGGDMTTHYSAAEISELVEAVRKIEVPLGSAPTLTVIRAQAA